MNISKELTPSGRVIGLIIPFILFWCGMLTPIFGDSVIVWILGMLPFYGFIYCGILFVGGKYPESFVISSIMNVFTSILLLVLLFLVPEEFTLVKNICRVGVLNIVPSLLFLFISATNSFVESIKGCPIPVIPFIIDGDS